MKLLNTNVHVNNQQVLFSYPGSSGIAQPKYEQLRRVEGNSYWHLLISEEEAKRLKKFGIQCIDAS